MINKKIVIGGIFSVMLLVSTATAVVIHKESDFVNISNVVVEPTTDTNNVNDVYVDSNILITKNKLPLLRASIKNIKKQEYKAFFKRVIQTLEEKENVNSEDLKQILIDMEMSSTKIYSGFINGKDDDFGVGMGFPFLGYFSSRYIPIPELVVLWSANGNPNFKINGHHIDYEHSGLIFLYVGTVYFLDQAYIHDYTLFELHGIGLFIMITPK